MKVIHAILVISPQTATTQDVNGKLWLHEHSRGGRNLNEELATVELLLEALVALLTFMASMNKLLFIGHATHERYPAKSLNF